MQNIAIVGAGRVGQAFNRILQTTSLAKEVVVTFIDRDPAALATIKGTAVRQADGRKSLGNVLSELKPVAVICSTPFYINTQVAEIAATLGAHYIDFTEDNQVTRTIEALKVTKSTFVPQTGLAPGLVSYIGHSLVGKLGEPHSLDLRVGALPLVSFAPDHYAITWSPNGLINEYLKPAFRKESGKVVEVKPLVDLERLIVDGRQYEGFTTAGGVGNLTAYDHIPNVEYKTLRYPGHLEFLRGFFERVKWDADEAVKLATTEFCSTRDDVVVLVAHATDTVGNSASAGLHFYPNEALQLTALELTTSGTGVAVLELIMSGKLPKGTLLSHHIPLESLRQTEAGTLVFASAR